MPVVGIAVALFSLSACAVCCCGAAGQALCKCLSVGGGAVEIPIMLLLL